MPDISAALPPNRQDAQQAAVLAQQQAMAAQQGHMGAGMSGPGGTGIPASYGLPPGMSLTPQQVQQMGLPPGMNYPMASAPMPSSQHQAIPRPQQAPAGPGQGVPAEVAMMGKSYEEEFAKWRRSRATSITEPTGVMVMDEDQDDAMDDENFAGIFGSNGAHTIGLITSQYPEAAPSLQEPPPEAIFGSSPMVDSSLGVSPGLAMAWASVSAMQNRRNSIGASPNLISFGNAGGAAFPAGMSPGPGHAQR